MDGLVHHKDQVTPAKSAGSVPEHELPETERAARRLTTVMTGGALGAPTDLPVAYDREAP